MPSREGNDEDGADHRAEGTDELERRPQGTPMNRSETSSQDDDWFRITFSVPWLVRGAKRPQDAINITISEIGKQLSTVNDRIRDTDIEIQQINCTECGASTECLLLVAETAFVGVLLAVTLRAEAATQAETLARRTIGPHFPDIPLPQSTSIEPRPQLDNTRIHDVLSYR